MKNAAGKKRDKVATKKYISPKKRKKRRYCTFGSNKGKKKEKSVFFKLRFFTQNKIYKLNLFF